MQLIDYSCKEFAEKLSSTEPFPGGGGASAMVGALGAALGSMAVQLTLCKTKDEETRERLSRYAIQLKGLQDELMSLVDEDAAAFEPLAKAYKVPKDDKNREEIMTKTLMDAVVPPVLIMRGSCKIIELLEELYEKVGRYLISDIGCGCILAGSALRAASMNVYINTSLLKDEQKKEELEDEADSMLKEYIKRADLLSEQVTRVIRKGMNKR